MCCLLLLRKVFSAQAPVKIFITRQDKRIPTKEKPADRKELILNKRTKLEDPSESEMDFDLQKIDEETVEAIDSSVEELQENQNNTLVNIGGHVLFNYTADTVDVLGKPLTKQESLFTDSSGFLRLVLWEQDTRKMKSSQSYNVSNVAIKEFNGANYLTLTKYGMVIEANKLKITRQNDVPDNIQQLKVQFPPDGVNYFQYYLSCNKCHSNVRVYTKPKLAHGSAYGLVHGPPCFFFDFSKKKKKYIEE